MSTRRIIDHATKFVAEGLSHTEAIDLACTKLSAAPMAANLARTIWERM